MLAPSDDVLSMNTDSNGSPSHHESGCSSMVLDTDVDMLLTASNSHERMTDVAVNDEGVRMREDELMSLGDSQCQLTDEDFGSVDDLFDRISSEVESVETVDQCDSASGNCSEAVPLADAELCPADNRAVDSHKDISHAAVVCREDLGAMHENEVSCTDVNELRCCPVQHADLRNDVLFHTRGNSDTEHLQDVEQHHIEGKTCAQPMPLASPEPHTGSDDKGSETDSVSQCTTADVLEPENDSNVTDIVEVEIRDDEGAAICREGLGAVHENKVLCTDIGELQCSRVLEPENESSVTDIVEVEIRDDKGDGTSADNETDSDCVIQDESRSEAFDSECEIGMDSFACDHSYSMSTVPAVVTSSNAIRQEYTSQAGVIFSVPSLQACDLNVAAVLPFPNLITDPNTNALCSYTQSQSGEHIVGNVSLLGLATMELMDTSASRHSGHGDNSDCLVMGSSSYPVVEIVPCSDEGDADQLERSDLSSQEPRSTADATVLSTVHAQSDNTSSGNVAASSSHRTKARIVSHSRDATYLCLS